ncbi:mycothiol acetyltransferase [bacterium BMS3Bbin04]|nr:mycothiol acetyltransferase [bacterium BMS3Bbin04]
MRQLSIEPLGHAHAVSIAAMMEADGAEYRSGFHPFPPDSAEIAQILRDARQDRYWGMFIAGELAGFMMLRGWDEGYQRPSFGVYVAKPHGGRGLGRLALDWCLSFCRSNDIPAMMLKVYPSNTFAVALYESAGFDVIGTEEGSGQSIMEKRWKVSA